MLKNVLTLSLVAGLVVACGKKDEAKSADNTNAAKPTAPAASAKNPETPPAKPAPASASLVIKAAKLTISREGASADDAEEIALDDEGNISTNGNVVGKISVDGTVSDAEGKKIASIAADGTVTIEGESEVISIAADGALTAKGKEVGTISEDGVFAMEELSEKVVYEGPKEARQAIMLAFAVGVMAADSGDDDAEVPAGTAAEPAIAPSPAKGELVDKKAGDEGCLSTFEGRCFAKDEDACRAAGCELDNCLVAESMPSQVSCKK